MTRNGSTNWQYLRQCCSSKWWTLKVMVAIFLCTNSVLWISSPGSGVKLAAVPSDSCIKWLELLLAVYIIKPGLLAVWSWQPLSSHANVGNLKDSPSPGSQTSQLLGFISSSGDGWAASEACNNAELNSDLWLMFEMVNVAVEGK